MQTKQDDSYEDHGATFQCLEIARLNEVLKEQGVTDAVQRRAICEAFIFSQGAFLDQGWFESEGRRLWPTLCFAERAATTEEGIGEVETLHLPSEHFSFHEYAGGDIYWFFDEHGESASDINAGFAGHEA